MQDFLAQLDEFATVKLFEINQMPITVSSVVMFLVMLGAFYIFSKLIIRNILRRVLPRFDIEPGTQFNSAGSRIMPS